MAVYTCLYMGLTKSMIDNDTLTLLDQPDQLKYKWEYSPITWEYEVITTFMEINNISATWEEDPYFGPPPSNTTFQLRVGSYWCRGDEQGWECCPPM